MLRRDFCKTSLLGLAGLMLPARAHAVGDAPRLFVVVLRGGADGLSLVSPTGSTLSTLKTLRPTTAVTTPVAIGPGVGLHPALAPLLDPSLGGRLNVVLHAGSTNISRSHADQQFRLETGDAVGSATDGFLARASSAAGLPTAAVSAVMPISVQPGAPVVLTDPATVGTYFARYSITPSMSRAQRLGLMQIGTNESGVFAVDEAAREAREQLDVLEPELAGLTLANLTSAHGYRPTSVLSQRLATAAALSSTSLAPRLIAIDSVEHWDTHLKQNTNDVNAWKSVAGSIRDLGDGLLAFHKDLVARGLWNNSVVLVMTEFGRTVRENVDGGTDHGRGGVVLALGGRVRPFADTAYLGTRSWTLPATATSSTALTVQHDSRLVLCEVLERHMGMTSSAARAVFRNQLPAGGYLGIVG